LETDPSRRPEAIIQRMGLRRFIPQDPVYLLMGRVVRYLEFESLWVKKNRASWKQTPISAHCGVCAICETGSFGKNLLSPPPHFSLVTR
jgi:hypothetical protein